MAFRCVEGFEDLASISDISLRSWRQTGGTASWKYSSSAGRRGKGCVYDDVTGDAGPRGMEYHVNFFRTTDNILPTPTATTALEIGFAFKITGNWSAWAGTRLTLGELVSASSGTACSVEAVKSGGLWYLQHSMNGSNNWMISLQTPLQFAGTDGFFETDRWYYVTWAVSGFESSVSTNKRGFIAIDRVIYASRVNSTALNCSNVDFDYFRLGVAHGVSPNMDSGCAAYFDDVFIAGTFGTAQDPQPIISTTVSPWDAQHTLLGPIRVDAVYGFAENTFFDDQFVASSGAGNDEYPMLDDAPHDGDTTYVSSSTVSHKAQGGWNVGTGHNAGLPSGFDPTYVHGVKANVLARSDTAGTPTVRCDQAYVNGTGTGSFTYALPGNGSYEGLHSIGSNYMGTSGGATGSKYTPGDAGTLKNTNGLLTYVS